MALGTLEAYIKQCQWQAGPARAVRRTHCDVVSVYCIWFPRVYPTSRWASLPTSTLRRWGGRFHSREIFRNPWHAQVYRDMSHIPRSPMCIDGLHNRKISGVQAANPPLERRERPNRPALGSVNYCRLPHDDDTYDTYTRQCAGRQYLYTAKLPPTSAADAMLGRSKSLHWELRAGAETACTL